MLEINNIKFAKNKKEYQDSLFSKSGTCFGFYKKLKNKIIFMDSQKEPFAFIATNKNEAVFFGNCQKQLNNRIFYQPCLSIKNELFFGIDDTWTYAETENLATNILNSEFNLNLWIHKVKVR